MPKEILTATDVGVALGVSSQRVHQMIRAGEIPFIRVGTRGVRIPRGAFEGWLAEKNREATAAQTESGRAAE